MTPGRWAPAVTCLVRTHPYRNAGPRWDWTHYPPARPTVACPRCPRPHLRPTYRIEPCRLSRHWTAGAAVAAAAGRACGGAAPPGHCTGLHAHRPLHSAAAPAERGRICHRRCGPGPGRRCRGDAASWPDSPRSSPAAWSPRADWRRRGDAAGDGGGIRRAVGAEAGGPFAAGAAAAGRCHNFQCGCHA